MSIADIEHLYDVLVRLQIHVEAVKASEALLFNEVMRDAHDEFKKLLQRLDYKTLDGLTKRELNLLIAKLNAAELKVYAPFLKLVEAQLKRFLVGSLKVSKIVLANTFTDEDAEDRDNVSEEDADDFIAAAAIGGGLFGLAALYRADKGAKLWAKVMSEPIAANGVLPMNFVKAFVAAGPLGLSNIVRRGYANAWTPQQTIAESLGLLNKQRNQYTAVSATVMQHISAMVSAGVASSLYGKYKWISVIDSGTTDFCRKTDQSIFVYGAGPMPPAHVACRSHTMPYTGKADVKESFFSFIKRQSESIQNIALGKNTAKMLADGKLESKDVIKLSDPKPMSIDEFSDSAGRIIKG